MNGALGLSTSMLWPRPLPECLSMCAATGFSLLEITPWHLFRDITNSQAAEALAQQAAAEGITIATLHLPFGSDYDFAGESEWRFQQAFMHLRQLAEVAQVLHAQALIIHPTDAERYRIREVDKVLVRIRRRVESLLAVCQSLGLSLALEHMLPHLIGGRVEELQAIADPLPQLRYCMDVSHASFSGDLLRAIRDLGARLAYVHASDNRGESDDHLIPGEGTLPWPAIVSALERISFSGGVLLEPGPRTVSFATLRELYQNMAMLFHIS